MYSWELTAIDDVTKNCDLFKPGLKIFISVEFDSEILEEHVLIYYLVMFTFFVWAIM